MLKKLFLATILSSILLLPYAQTAHAANGANWVAGNIINDGVFANANAMSVADVQAFLNQKVGAGGSRYATPGFCDTQGTRTSEFGGGTRAQYAASRGRSTPFTCLKDFYEVPKTAPSPGVPANNYGGAPIPAGAKSAAQLIWDAGQRYSINPRVLLVMIQKESAGPLITDDWPFLSQYTYAMGAHCPDSGPGGAANCNSNYAGFSMQIHESARLFRYYITNMDQPWWTYKKLGNNSILYQNSRPECGSSVVNIVTRATAALYTYTPYQPNQAALNNLYGTGNACSAYGNRNFWRMFIDWFGSTQTNIPYAWNYVSNEVFADSARTVKFTSRATVVPGGTVYVRMKARNIGYQTWSRSNLHLGTARPMDRSSIFTNSSWLAPQRPAKLVEQSVTPGQLGTFEFSMKAPAITGTYSEYFSLLVEGVQWLNNPGYYLNLNVNTTAIASDTTNTLSASQALGVNDYLLSTGRQATLSIRKNGSLALYSNFMPNWTTPAAGNSDNRLVMQQDGNLVLYSSGNVPLWNSETAGSPGARLVLQNDGNMVIYSSTNTPLWATYTFNVPSQLAYINTGIASGVLFPRQEIATADRQYRLVLQQDGNLVLYKDSTPLWATGTDGKDVAFLSMQPDGHLVLYNKNLQAAWFSKTAGYDGAKLTIQEDGNLVIYSVTGHPVWNTETAGR